MYWEQSTQYATLSDIGFRRRNNQDSCIVQICSDRETWSRRGHLFMVADGMGGHAVGELASKMAVDIVPHTFFKSRVDAAVDALKGAIEAANATIYERGVLNRDFLRMGTTCSVLVLGPRGALIGHVGDSRVYRIRDDRIDQLTFDHSLQWELLKQGKLTPEEIFLNHPRNIITRSLGPDGTVAVDLEGPYAVLPGDTFVICSDGLVNHLKDAEIGMIARKLPVDVACRLLVNLANLRGGSDNITVVMVRAGEVPKGASHNHPEPRPDEGDPASGWGRLAAGWALASTLVAGIWLMMVKSIVPGLLLIGICLLSIVASTGVWLWRRLPSAVPQTEDETVHWRSYRSTTAALSPQFLSQLAKLEANLQRTALDEGWSIEWSEHVSAYSKAKSALAEKRYDDALADYAAAIDVLIAGLHIQRKQGGPRAKAGESSV